MTVLVLGFLQTGWPITNAAFGATSLVLRIRSARNKLALSSLEVVSGGLGGEERSENVFGICNKPPSPPRPLLLHDSPFNPGTPTKGLLCAAGF